MCAGGCDRVWAVRLCSFVQLTGNIDIFMSHDWPTEIYHHGNLEQLLRFKPYFRREAMSNTLGSPAAKELLDHLQPQKWWSGHLHCRFEACYVHGPPKDEAAMLAMGNLPAEGFPMGKGILGDSPFSTAPMGHPLMGWSKMEHTPMGEPGMGHTPMEGPGMGNPPTDQIPPISHPPKVTEFLALDKCLPKRKCLEVCVHVCVRHAQCCHVLPQSAPHSALCPLPPPRYPRCLTSPRALTQRH